MVTQDSGMNPQVGEPRVGAPPNSQEVLELQLTVRDQDLVGTLRAHDAGRPREEFALTALRIGILALEQAHGHVDAGVVRSEGDRLIAELGSVLEAHEQRVDQKLGGTLKEYFDPTSGRLQERIERLLKNDGELERVIRNQVDGEGSTLSSTLEAFLGEDSSLIRTLDSEDPDGALGQLKVAVEATVRGHRDELVREFSLDNPDGALVRLLNELEGKTDQSRAALAEQVESVVGEFSLDDEGSALSRLVARVDQAHSKIGAEFSLDNEGSALARMKKGLEGLFETQEKKNNLFQQEVRESLAALSARREERDRSTRHGEEFEIELALFLEERAMESGDLVDRTGATTGHINHCKKGDCVVQLGTDHRAAGSRIVVEAKQDQSYTMARAATEIEEARKNRAAGVGLFVFSARTAPGELDCLSRRGDDIFVVWDSEDASTDPSLLAALELARGLVAAGSGNPDQDLDREEIERAAVRIESALSDLDAIQTTANTVRSGGQKILDRVEKLRKKVMREIEQIRSKTGGGARY
jgi:hypothetical protein